MHVLVGVGLGLAAATKMGLTVGGAAAGGIAAWEIGKAAIKGIKARKFEEKTGTKAEVPKP